MDAESLLEVSYAIDGKSDGKNADRRKSFYVCQWLPVLLMIEWEWGVCAGPARAIREARCNLFRILTGPIRPVFNPDQDGSRVPA